MARSQLNKPSACSLSAESLCSRIGLCLLSLSSTTRVQFLRGLWQAQALGLTKTSCSTGAAVSTRVWVEGGGDPEGTGMLTLHV